MIVDSIHYTFETILHLIPSVRLFSCGTSKEGTTFLVEWNEIEGTVKTTYSGFKRKSAGVVQFDTTQNHFLAAGEDNQIKFWHANCQILLGSIDADGGLPVSISLCVLFIGTETVQFRELSEMNIMDQLNNHLLRNRIFLI